VESIGLWSVRRLDPDEALGEVGIDTQAFQLHEVFTELW